LVDDVFRVLDAHAIDQAVIAGESLGGMVCLQAVLRGPSRLKGLVLVGSGPRTPPLRENAAFDELRKDWPAYIADFVAACLPEPDAAALHRLGQGALLPAGAEAGVRMFAVNARLSPELEAIKVPTLVVHGARDAIAPLDRGRELANRIPGAAFVILEDAGHVPILTRPDAVVSAIESWWAHVGRPTEVTDANSPSL
jgi:pimeloyl-ACP methyl ester carboxylesterase